MACTSHVIQLAAVHGGYNFSAYVTHKRPITPSASLVTCLVVWNGKLYRFQKEVNAPSLIAALDSFLKFLDKYSYTNVILIGHHKKIFWLSCAFQIFWIMFFDIKFFKKDERLLIRISDPIITHIVSRFLYQDFLVVHMDTDSY